MMGLRETFQRAAVTAMTAADNVPDRATYHYLAYNEWGQATGADELTFTDIPALRIDYTVQKVDEIETLQRVRRYLVTGLDLDLLEPREDDTLDVNGETWTIQLVGADPAGATYTLHVRR